MYTFVWRHQLRSYKHFRLDLASTESYIVQNTINFYNPTFQFYNNNPHSFFFLNLNDCLFTLIGFI